MVCGQSAITEEEEKEEEKEDEKEKKVEEISRAFVFMHSYTHVIQGNKVLKITFETCTV